MNQRDFYVYLYFRPDGTPCYVGKGKGARWQHRGKWGRNRHFLSIRAQAKSADLEMPCVKLSENLTDAEALSLEKVFIAAIGREANGGPLVNLTDGGDGASGSRRTKEQCDHMRAIRLGRSLSPEWRAAISASMNGKPKTAEHIANAGAAQRGNPKSSGWWSTPEGRAKQKANNRGNSGCHYSDEARESIRRAAIRQHASIHARNRVSISTSWAETNSVRFSMA